MKAANERQIVVIGGGPAGASASFHLARMGHEVLLLDKDDFPRDKPCGDCLSHESCHFLATAFGLGLEQLENAGLHPIIAARTISPSGLSQQNSFRPGVRMGVLPRRRLDNILVEHATRRGVKLQRGKAIAVLRENNRVRGVVLETGEKVFSRVTVLADGANSSLARALSPIAIPPTARAVAVRAYLSGLTVRPHVAEFFFRRELLPAYAWIFPVDDRTANVGCAIDEESLRERRLSPRGIFHTFLQLPELRRRGSDNAEVHSFRGWPLHAGVPGICQRSHDGALLIGDAGRFVRPFEGEGIHGALLSGLRAAEVIHNALEINDVSAESLSRFDQWFQTEIQPQFTDLYRRSRFALHHPTMIDCTVFLSTLLPSLAKRFSICGDYLP